MVDWRCYPNPSEYGELRRDPTVGPHAKVCTRGQRCKSQKMKARGIEKDQQALRKLIGSTHPGKLTLIWG